MTYDAAGSLLTRRDDNNHTTTFAYDAADRLVSKIDPLNRTWTYSYDGVGNKTQVVGGNGNATTGDPNDGKTTYSYDTVDRLTGINYSDSTSDVSFTYDLAGRKTSMTDGAGSVGYGYDNANRPTTITRGSSGFSYSYDSAGRLAARTYPDSTATSYGYDNDNRLSTVTVGSTTTGYTYDAAGRITATAYPNSWTEQRSYDNADRLTDIRSVNGANTLAVATYTRDNAGNPTTIVRDSVTETYAYDNADRITAACYGGQIATCATGSKITYAYDKVGNRASQTKFGTTTTYAYDAADELTSTTTGGSTTNYTYDNDGQQTGQGTKTFTYNLAGQLTQVANSGSVLASFTYDGAGNRLTKTANSITTTYWWDENNPLAMLALEQQGSSVLRSYVYADRLLSMSSSGTAYYFHHDALGTTAAITKSTGATEWTYTSDPYGVNRTTTKVDPAAPDNPIQYTGELLDAETGLYDLRARVYDPGNGRFLSTDPLEQDAEQALLALYQYANDNPLGLTDPSGQAPVWEDDAGNSHIARPCTHGGWWYTSPDECPPPGTAPPLSGSGGDDEGDAGDKSKPKPPCRGQARSCHRGGRGNMALPDDPHDCSLPYVPWRVGCEYQYASKTSWGRLAKAFGLAAGSLVALAAVPELGGVSRAAVLALRAARQPVANGLGEIVRGVTARLQPLYESLKGLGQAAAYKVGAKFEPQRLREGLHDMVIGASRLKADPVRAIATIIRGVAKIIEARQVAKYPGRR